MFCAGAVRCSQVLESAETFAFWAVMKQELRQQQCCRLLPLPISLMIYAVHPVSFAVSWLLRACVMQLGGSCERI